MFHHTLGGPKLREEEHTYSIRGHTLRSKLQHQHELQQKADIADSSCDVNSNSQEHNSNLISKRDERYSFRKMAKNLLFSSEHQQKSDNNKKGSYNNYVSGNYHNYHRDQSETGYWKTNNPKQSQSEISQQVQLKTFEAYGNYGVDEYGEDLNGILEVQHRLTQNHIKPEINDDLRFNEYPVKKIHKGQDYNQSLTTIPSSNKMKTAIEYDSHYKKTHGKAEFTCKSTSNNNNYKALQANKGILNSTLYSKTEYLNNPTFRTVAITSIPKKMTISSLLSQLYGGPIERIELVRKDNYSKCYNEESSMIYNNEKLNKPINWNEIAIFIYFSKNEDAKNFYQYSKTGLFKVNDIHLKTTWIPNYSKNNHLKYNEEMRLEDENEDIYTETDLIKQEEEIFVTNLMKGGEQARRVLVFKKLHSDKKSSKSNQRKGTKNPTSHFCSTFDVEDIKKDFGPYGKLIEILPVVSRKLCFGIQYYDVRSAIMVKSILQHGINGHDEKELDSRDSNLRMKYHDWGVWYGKDPADRGIPI